ncbi:UNVERIFIED_CONTAM: hypothetical protein BEN50_04900 [Euhalothece sp. KZN 001]
MSKKQVIFRIPEAKAQALQEKAKADGKSITQVLESLVDSYLSDDNSIDNTSDNSDNSIDNVPDTSDNFADNTLEKVEVLIEERLKPLQAKIEEQQQKIRELRADYRELKLEQREAKLDQRELSFTRNDNTSDNIKDNRENKSDNTTVIQKDKPRVVSDGNGVNRSNLAERLGVNKNAISKAKKRANFREYTKKKDPEGKAWRYDEQLQLFFMEDEDDQSDCKASHKPSDDGHPISNDGKYQSEPLENVPSVERRDLYLDQTPSNGSPKHGANHKDEMAHHTA